MPAVIIPDSCDDDDVESSSSHARLYEMDTGGTDNPYQSADFVGQSLLERERIRRDREREGRCADCGMQTHEFKHDALTGNQVKVPLSVDREVHRGRCLLCYPIFPPEFLSLVQGLERPRNHSNRQYEKMPVNQTLDDKLKLTTPSLPLLSVANNGKPSRRVSHAYALGHHDPTDPMVKEALRMLQGMTLDIVDIISAMKRASHDRVVQEKGCERLWVLSWEDENSAAIGRVGGIPVILDAMARFPMNAHLQQCACESLQNLAHVNRYNRREIVDSQGVNMIVQAMVRHMDCAGIQQCGCTAIASISATRELVRHVMAAGGFHAVLVAAQRFSNDPSVLRAAYDSLQLMGYDPVGRLPPFGVAYIN